MRDKSQVQKSGTASISTKNLLRDPDEVVVELTEGVLQELAGPKKLHQLRYPTCVAIASTAVPYLYSTPPHRYVVCTHPNFELCAIDGLTAIKGTALKELDLASNRLTVLDALEQVGA